MVCKTARAKVPIQADCLLFIEVTPLRLEPIFKRFRKTAADNRLQRSHEQTGVPGKLGRPRNVHGFPGASFFFRGSQQSAGCHGSTGDAAPQCTVVKI